MKVNLGSGYRRIEGFVNVDDDPLCEPEYLVNLEKDKLPFEDNSVEEMIAHHILEHIGEGFIPLMQEIYRVCKHGAIIDIRVPHPTHELFLNDPTHKRPIMVEGMRLFSKKYMDEHLKTIRSSSGMAYKFNVDFEIVYYNYIYDTFYHSMIESFVKRQSEGKTSKEEEWAFERLFREANNVAMETEIKLVVIKE
jgi:predicted SAM-dependent methyltransferase